MDTQAFEWMMKHEGVPSEEAYGAYLAADGLCHHAENASMSERVRVSGFGRVRPVGDVEAHKAALVGHGPLSVSISANHMSLLFYSNGVYYEKQCGNGEADLDHSVLLVGYGQLDGHDYWLVKNSWYQEKSGNMPKSEAF